MMLDWTGCQGQSYKSIGPIRVLSPDPVGGYRTLGEAGSSSGTLGEKTRELISLAVAVSPRCDGCITTHTSAAINAGATKVEIAESLGVAIAVSAGVALAYSARVMDAYVTQPSDSITTIGPRSPSAMKV